MLSTNNASTQIARHYTLFPSLSIYFFAFIMMASFSITFNCTATALLYYRTSTDSSICFISAHFSFSRYHTDTCRLYCPANGNISTIIERPRHKCDHMAAATATATAVSPLLAYITYDSQ